MPTIATIRRRCLKSPSAAISTTTKLRSRAGPPSKIRWSSRIVILASELSEPADDSYDSEPAPVDFDAEQTVAHIQPDERATREDSLPFPGHAAAPEIAPEGRTLEHETLEDEEMEFHPVPEDIEALSEAAADSDLDLVEETLDADNGYGERWLPKIADVDEDEVLAAESAARPIRLRAKTKTMTTRKRKRPTDAPKCAPRRRPWLISSARPSVRAMIAADSVAAAAAAATTFALVHTPTAHSR